MSIKVSIVIPVYNGANYLSQAIDSALGQTYKNIEIIVVNDGSNDNGATEEVALGYGEKIRYFKKENGGVSSALNFGIKMMEGDYFSWLSHDDLYDKTKIEKQVALIENKNDIILCPSSLIDENGKEIPYPMRAIAKKLSGAELLSEYVEKGYQLNGLGFLIPRSVFEKIGYFNTDFRYIQDTLLWFQIMQGGYRFICHREKLTMGRVHRDQVSNKFPEFYYSELSDMAEIMGESVKTLISEKKEFMRLYLFFFQKTCCKEGVRIFKKMMKDAGEYTFSVRLGQLKYFVKGNVKEFLKKIYNAVLKTKGCRG